MPAKFFALWAAYNSADVVLIDFRAADFMSQGVNDVTPELFHTVCIHGQHVSVLEHVPESADVGGVAPREYPLRFGGQRRVHVLGLQEIVPAHGFRGGVAASVPCKIMFK